MTKLIHEIKAFSLTSRTINALHKAGIDTWEGLVEQACLKPNTIRGIHGLGREGVKEIIRALEQAKVPHTIQTRRARATSSKP